MLNDLQRSFPLGCLLCLGFILPAAGATVLPPIADLAKSRLTALAGSEITVSDYPDGSLTPDAIWTIGKVSPERRRMGFFSVNVLPVLVVRGIQVAFINPHPQTNWLEGFRCDWSPAGNRAVFEWRDFSISFPHETTPRVQVSRVYPAVKAGSLIGRLEGVTLNGFSQPVHIARAELRADGGAGEIVWQESAGTVRWDLFSRRFTTNLISQPTSHEKS